MQKQSFNDNWIFGKMGNNDFRPVTIPHDAMLCEKRSPQNPGGANTGWYEGHDYIYEKRFKDTALMNKAYVALEFEGVYKDSEVYINEHLASKRPYGYTNFYVDIKKYLMPGENVIRVIAKNTDQPNSRWYSGAGIYRPVNLWTADASHILMNGLKVRTLSANPACIEVQVHTSVAGEVQVEILDGDTVIYGGVKGSDGKVNFTIPLAQAKLWTPDYPRLYLCRARLGNDIAETRFGIRTLTWGEGGLHINGERVILQGACVHHDNGFLGAACYPDAEGRKVRLLKEAGYNAIRSAHNPCSKALLDACDCQGMLVMDEYIDYWYIHKTEYDYVDHFQKWWRQDLLDMAEKDYNHPSVIMYSIGNEVSETAQQRGILLTKEMTEYLHTVDNTRPVTCGVNIFFNFLSSIGFGVYSDKKAKREAERAERYRKAGTERKKAVGSQFFNNLAGLMGADFMKLGATLHGCDVKTRDAFANMDIAGYNYGILRYCCDLKKYPARLILGSETFCSDAYRFRELAKKEPRLLGDFVWAGMDYLGEVGVGAWEYRDYAPDFDGFGWVSAGSGRIDLTGKALCEVAYTKVALEQSKGPFIGVCPVNHSGEKHSPSAWKMSNAIASWSWHGCEGKKANVEVYARAAEVELRINGRTAGRKKIKRNDCLVKFSCRYEDGTVEAIAFDTLGRETGRSELHTAGTETKLRAVAEQPIAHPGGLCYIRLCYTDYAGIVKPLKRGILKVQVSGGRLVGIGNACPYNTHSYLEDETDTYYGEALAIVQADRDGEILLQVSDGFYTGAATVPIRREEK